MTQKGKKDNPFDLFIIGGGVNGCAIARDASGRGLSVGLAEMNDLASATSSASTKLFHGGLRYLEYFEIRLVKEALIEREILLKSMPHISWPMRFVLPYNKDMRFEGTTPASKILSFLLPWMRGRRPAWLIRLGLFMYDHLGGREILPATTTLKLRGSREGDPLSTKFERAFEYSDCWVEDSRLVVLTARDAQNRGAQIMTRAKVETLIRHEEHWEISVSGDNGSETFFARTLVNAAGPWVEDIATGLVGQNNPEGVRLVKGSHIVTRKLYEHDKCYFFQGSDGRIIFSIPYERDFTLIGTTDIEHDFADTRPVCTDDEIKYLCDFASEYFSQAVTSEDIVWTYSGVRPLYDDGASSASAATREYILTLDENGPPVLNVYGGKITSSRKLAEAALKKLAPFTPNATAEWTKNGSLPGGDFEVAAFGDLVDALLANYSFLEKEEARRLVRAYGTDSFEMLKGVMSKENLGTSFGHGIYAKELEWAVEKEWVKTAEDFLWRRTKQGLRTTADETQAIDGYIKSCL